MTDIQRRWPCRGWLDRGYSCRAPTLFLLAVQWHPEWKAKENPHSIKLFSAFGDACRQYRQRVG
ncbi:hypothetical protein ACEUBB_03480 [Aeromonas rivipollensis]|uniref:hypothetical protein n=1 Tax=Aeromonas rivipollensis TaxID=948519 RepID=UPI0038D14F2C